MTSTTLLTSQAFTNFRRNEVAVSRLAELLNDPTLNSALRLVEDLSKPTRLPDTTPGLHPDTVTSHHMHMLIGVGEAVKKLRRLATFIKPGEIDSDADSPDRPEYSDHADKIQPLGGKA